MAGDGRGHGVSTEPSLYAYTQLPVADLPFGLRGEAYGQAGYVGGIYATGFADAQAKVERALQSGGRREFRAGLGAWGGAQEGASRLDFGPTASLDLPMDEGSMRLALDWRFRVAGNAEPQSGPALTISAGF